MKKTKFAQKIFGFTLIEILIVVTIIAIVGIAGSVNYVAQRQKYTLITTAEKIKASIEQARTDAINGKFFSDNGLFLIKSVSESCIYIGPKSIPDYSSSPPTIIDQIPKNCTATNIFKLPVGVNIIKPSAEKSATFILNTGVPSIDGTYNNKNSKPNDGLILEYGSFKISIYISPTGVISTTAPYQ